MISSGDFLSRSFASASKSSSAGPGAAVATSACTHSLSVDALGKVDPNAHSGVPKDRNSHLGCCDRA